MPEDPTIEKLDDPKPYSVQDMLLYKADRTIAILGVIVLGGWALQISTPDTTQITMAAIGGLVGYIGGRAAK